MDELLRRAVECFGELCDASPREQDERLAEIGRADPALRARVEELLAGDRLAGDRLDAANVQVVVDAAAAPRTPEQVGSYRIVRLLGSGGMGAVFEAEQEVPHRTVALKLIHAFASPRMRRRFEREIDVLARLNHPGIARIFDAGTTTDGQPFFAMELVEGQMVLDHANERSLPVAGRLELIARICDAVEHAHQRGVVHRDLKPGNVLVAATGEPKVLDFGIARLLGESRAGTLRTSTGEVLGTLAYMSPEQAAGSSGLDEHSDVYSLGVIAHELLAGTLPLDVRNLAVPEALSAIAQLEPVRPSTVRRELAGDVETILLKCLEKEPGRRYASAGALAADLRRHLSDEPILARAPTTGYQLWKFARRNRGLVGGLAAAGAALVAGAAVSLWQNVRLSRAEQAASGSARLAAREAERARSEARSSDRVLDFVVDMFERRSADRLEGTTLTVKEVLDDQAARLRDELEDEPEARGRLLSTVGDVYRSLALFEEALPLEEEAVVLLRRSAGDEHAWTLEALENLAAVRHELGDYEQAAAWRREVLETCRRTTGEESPESLEAMTALAGTLHRLARHEESLQLYERALEVQTRTLGEEHPSTLTTMNDLALLYDKLGRRTEAVELAERGLELRRRVYGEEHPRTITALSNLAVVSSNAGKVEEAEALMEQVLAVQVRTLGARHHRVLTTLDNLGTVQSELGLREEAEEHLVQALEGRRELLGDAHHDTQLSRNNLAALYEQTGRADEAEALLVEAVRIGVPLYGGRDPLTALLVWRLGDLFARQGRSDGLERLYLDMIEEAGPTPAGFRTLVALSRAYDGRAATGDADATRTEALYAFEDMDRSRVPEVVDTVLELAPVLRLGGRAEDAERLCRRTLRCLGDGDADGVRALDLKEELLEVLAEEGRRAEAAELAREVLDQTAVFDPRAGERRERLGALLLEGR